MSKEITIRASIFSDELTRAASLYLLGAFGGFYATEGDGGYKFMNGQTEMTRAVSWQIGTAAKDSERFAHVSAFARLYCSAGSQESIYFLDSDGAVYLVNANGRIDPIV